MIEHRLTQAEAAKTIAFLKGECSALMEYVTCETYPLAQRDALANLCTSIALVINYIEGNLNTSEVIKPD